MMKIGDKFKDKITGKIYIIRMETDNDTHFLEGEYVLAGDWLVKTV